MDHTMTQADVKPPDDEPAKRRAGQGQRRLLGAVPFLVVGGLWQLLSVWQPSTLKLAVPTLSATWRALWSDLVSDVLYSNTWVTFQEFIVGLAIAAAAGVGVGVIIGLVAWLERMLYPIIVFFQAIPKVALAPLLLIVFGFGMGSKIAVAATIAFFPILVGVIQGMHAIRLDEIDLLRSLNATPWQMFLRVRVPRALPATFAGFEVAAVFSLLGAVVTEFVGASSGLGYLVQFRSSRLDIPGVYSALIVLSLIGVVTTLVLAAIGRRLTRWEES